MNSALSLACTMTSALVFLHSTASADVVYTDTSEVHACIARGEETVAATGGGVVIAGHGSSRTLTALDGLPDGRAWALAQSGSSIFVGTDRGLAEIVGGAVKRTALDVSVRALAMTHGRLLAGTFGKGLAEVDIGTLGAAFVSVPDPRVLSISGDRIGTMGGTFVRSRGVFVQTDSVPTPPRSLSCAIPASTMPSNDVSAIAANDRGLWIGTFDRGLALLSNGHLRKIEGLDDRVDALVADRVSDRVWVGTARGLYAIDEGSSELPRLLEAVGTDEVHALAAREGGGVIAGTAHGAAMVRLGARVRGQVGATQSAAARKAGIVEESAKESVERIGSKDGLALPSVTAVLEDGGLLYLGTVHGLYVGKGKTFVRLSVASGHLPDDWVTALVADKGVVHAGTYHGGVVRLARKSEHREPERQTRRRRTARTADPIDGDWTAEKLGGGYVNPAGLAIHGATLFVATMDGLLSRTSGGAFVEVPALGRDVTAIAFAHDGAWIASRRGLLRRDGLGP